MKGIDIRCAVGGLSLNAFYDVGRALIIRTVFFRYMARLLTLNCIIQLSPHTRYFMVPCRQLIRVFISGKC